MVSFIATDGRTRSARARHLGALVVGAFGILRDWQVRARQRREIAALADRDLRDIGLTRAQLACELAKPFWRA